MSKWADRAAWAAVFIALVVAGVSLYSLPWRLIFH